MKKLQQLILVFCVAILCIHHASAQSEMLREIAVEGGVHLLQPQEFNEVVFPRLSSWGLQDEQFSHLAAFSLSTSLRTKWYEYGLYGTYMCNTVQGSAIFFVPSSTDVMESSYEGETKLGITRLSFGVHFGIDLLEVFSSREDFRLGWMLRGRAGGGVSLVTGTVDRYSLIKGASEKDAHTNSSLVLEGRLDTELTYKLGSRFRIGVYASLLYSGSNAHNLGEITRNHIHSRTRVNLDYTSWGGGIRLGFSF